MGAGLGMVWKGKMGVPGGGILEGVYGVKRWLLRTGFFHNAGRENFRNFFEKLLRAEKYFGKKFRSGPENYFLLRGPDPRKIFWLRGKGAQQNFSLRGQTPHTLFLLRVRHMSPAWASGWGAVFC
jgi:hypothetical protein